MTMCQSCKTRHGCFGYPGKSPVSCAAHKAEGMVDVVHPRCRSVGCSKRPSFGPPGAKPLACAAHRSPGWIDLKNKRAYHRRCQADGCELIPVFGSPDEAGSKGALRCRKHRLPGHVDVIHPQCEQEGCTLRPSFAFWPRVGEGGGGKKKPLRCREHKLAGMVDTKNRRCDEPSCSKKRLVGSRTCHSHTSPVLPEISDGISCSGNLGMKCNRSTMITEKAVGQTGLDTKEVHKSRGTAVQDPSTSRRPPQSGEGSQFSSPTPWSVVLIGSASGSSDSSVPLSSSSYSSCSPYSPSLARAPGSAIPTYHSMNAGESLNPAGENVKYAVEPVQGMMMHDQSGSDSIEADGSGLCASSPSSSLSLARRKALPSREEKLEPSSDGTSHPQLMLMLGLGPSPPAYLEVSSASPRSCEMEQVASACTDDLPNGHCFEDDRGLGLQATRLDSFDLPGVTSQTNKISGGSQVSGGGYGGGGCGGGGVDGKMGAVADAYVGDTTESSSSIVEGPSLSSFADENLLGFEISSGHTHGGILASRQTAHGGIRIG